MRKICVLLILTCIAIVARAQTTTFNYTGAVQTYTVPCGVTSITVDLAGGQGGNYPGYGTGGLGGRAQGTVAVTSGQVLYIYVGQQGTSSSGGAGGTNSGGGANGGNGGSSGGGAAGGGASDIRTSAGSTSTELSSRLIVAAGGGGGAYDCSGAATGGSGGGTTGNNGATNCGSVSVYSGQGGTSSAGGAGATGSASALPGGFGYGGAGTTWGGGGGGGWYGGGGAYEGGGGGGSSYISGSGVSSAATTTGYQAGNGYVTITVSGPRVAASTSLVNFGNVSVGTTAAVQVFSITGTSLTSSPITVNTTGSNFEFSFDGSTWYSTAQSYSFTLPGFTDIPIYVRFTPDVTGAFSDSISFSGGGLGCPAYVPVSGNGVSPCSGVPTAGTASISPGYGGSSTTFNLSLSGYSTSGGITFQWQSSTDNATWTNISGATNTTYSFSGLTTNTYYRCNVFCSVSSIVVSTSSVLAIYFPPSSCTPNFYNLCTAAPYMNTSIASLTGASGAITDPSSTCGPNYVDNTTMSTTLLTGSTTTATINTSTSYSTNFSYQIWIDFNNNGAFETTESVGGLAATTSATTTCTITVPSTVSAGTYRMRIVGIYKDCCPGGFIYPSLPSCPNGSSTDPNYGQARDYSVSIVVPPACATPSAQPTALTFGTSTLTTISGSFTAASPSAQAYLVVMTTSSVAPTAPANGTTYTVGTSALGGTIIANGSGTSFTATGLTPGTNYWFWVYSATSYCTGGTPPYYLTTSPLSNNTSSQACALSGVKTVGPTGDYTSITSALSAISASGIAGPIALELQTSYTGSTETLPVTIGNYPCASATNNITIRPQGVMTVTASYAGALISMNGARYVTIDGRVGSTGTTNALTLINNSTTGQVVQFINDASYDTLKYVTLRGSNTSSSSGVVVFGTTTGTTGNDNNTITSCDIMDAASTPTNCIYSGGTVGKENSGNTISSCNIANYYSASSASTSGIYLVSGNTGWTISNNRLYQTASRAYSGCWTHTGIYLNTGTAGNGFVVSGNIIGYSSSAGTGIYTMSASSCDVYRAIYLSVGTATASSVQGNTITNISISGTSSAFTFYGIYVTSGSVNIGTTTGNTIGATSGTGAITVTNVNGTTPQVVGIYATVGSPAVISAQNNSIGSINVTTGAATTGGFYGIYFPSTATANISNNTIGSTTTANSIQCSATSSTQPMYGIYASISSTTLVAPVISNNTIANLTNLATGTAAYTAGIYFNSTSSGNITGNTIRNISGACASTTSTTQQSVVGILYTGSTGTPTISQNTIYSIQNTNSTAIASHVSGISFSSGLNGVISRNKIYDIRNASTGTTVTSPPTANGIILTSPTTAVTLLNNMITLGNGLTNNMTYTGIFCPSNSTYTLKAYYNTISIEGTSTGALLTSCFNRGTYANSIFTATTVDLRNNIFKNTRSGGTGAHYAIGNAIGCTSSNAGGWASGASNYNIYYTANTANMGWWSAAKTFATWQTTSSCDNNSFLAGSSAAITFANSASGDLHINMGTTANDIEAHGTSISGFATDYDNETRPGPTSVNGGGYAPDLGADEFDGVPNDNLAPTITYTALSGACGTGDRTFTVSIGDYTGVPTSGTTRPRVYYKKSSGATWSSQPGTLASGSATSGTWSFTIPASDAVLTPLSVGDVVQYFIIAQDLVSPTPFVGSNPSAGLTASNVNTITTYPTTPNSYTVMLGLSGNYNVGTTGAYSTIGAAASAYNSACISGNVTFTLTDGTYPSETFPIQFNANAFASSSNTLTIKPATGTAVTINGPATVNSIFKFLNAKYITIDGVNSGGASLTLNSTYTSTFANIWIASTSGTGPGCNNITIKNTNIAGGTNTTTCYGILAGVDNGSTPTTTAGIDNDTITIQNNTITKCYYGIYATGTAFASSGGLNNWTISNNNIGPSAYSTTDNIGFRGIFISNHINPTITGNTIRNLGLTTLGNQVSGIYLSTGIDNATITQNTIRDITSTYTGTGTITNTGIYMGTNTLNTSVTRNTIYGITNAGGTNYSGRGIEVTTANAASNDIIANNMIYNISGMGYNSYPYWPVGIAIEGTSGGIKVYYNTVNMNSTFAGYNGTSGSTCFLSNTTGFNLDVRDNIFVNTYDNTTTTSDKGYAIYCVQTNNSAYSNIDYNDYYVASPNVLGYLSSDRTTVSGIQSGFGGNTNSLNVSPVFVSSTDQHLQPLASNASLIAATPLTSSVTTDFDGTTRSTTTPVQGAHEVNIPNCSSITAGTVAAVNPSLCVSGTTTVTATGVTTGIGASYQWKSSTDGSTFTAISGATNTSYTIPTAITATTYYRMVATCSPISSSDSGTATVAVYPLPGPITGTTAACVGTTTTLSDTTSGGTWTSGNASVATAGASTGVVTGVATGTALISYTSGAGCSQIATVAILTALSAPSITAGATTLCNNDVTSLTAAASTITLLDEEWETGLPTVAGTPVDGWTTDATNAGWFTQKTTGSHPSGVGPHSGTYFGSFNSWSYSGITVNLTSPSFSLSGLTGGIVTFWVYRDGTGSYPWTSGYTTEGFKIYVNTSPTISGGTLLGFVPRASDGTISGVSGTSTPGTGVSGWYQYTASIPGSFSGATNYVIINAVSQYGNDCYIDDISVTSNTSPATWTPTTDLYTDAAATTPYTTGATTNTVYVKPSGYTSSPATITYTSSITNNACNSTASQTLTVNPSPPAIAGTLSACTGGTSSLSNSVGGGTWSSSNAAIASVGSSSGVVTASGTVGTANISYTVSGCSAVSTFAVNASPGSITGTASVCTGATTTLGNSGGAGTWTSSNTSVATIGSSTGIVTGIATGTATISYVNGCATYVTTVVTVLQTPAAITGSSIVCEGATTTLSNATSGGTWSSSTTSVATIGASDGIVSGVLSGTTTITYTLGNGCTDATRTQTINPNPPTPTITPASSTTICYGRSSVFTASTSPTVSVFTWSGVSGADGVGCTPCATNTITPTALGANVYSVVATSNGCSSSTTVTVNTNPAPTVITGNTGVCLGGSSTLGSSPSGGTWSSSNTSVAVVTYTTGIMTGLSLGTATITYTAATGCFTVTPVTVNAVPSASPTSNGPICNGGTVTLNANPSSGATTYTWSGAGLSSTTAANPTATPTVSTVYSLTVSNGTGNPGCAPTTVYTTSVTVNAMPTAAPTNDGPICNGGTVTLTANPSGGASTYSWSGPNLSSAVVANPTATPTTTSVYSLTVTNGTAASGCSPTTIYTTTVTVNPTPTAAPTNTSPICNGGTVALSANPGGSTSTYTWSGPSLSSTTEQNPTATPTTTSVYSLVVTNGTAASGCSPSTVYTTSVTVNSTPTAAPTNSGVICNGGTVTLTANPSGGANTYSWSGSNLSSTTAQNPTATPTVTTTYSLTVSDGTGNPGCSPTTVYTTTVTVNPIPVAAPTNDGPICNGGTVNLAANGSAGATNFTWSGANLSATNISNPSATPSVTGTYSLTVSDGTGNPGCSPTTIYTTSVTVNSTPTAAPTNNSPICNGGTVALTANPGGSTTNYTWSGPNLSSATAQNPTATPTTNSVYSLVVTNGTAASGCAPSAIYTTSVTVNSTPTAAPTNSGVICNGGTVTLTANPSGGANTYSWSGPNLSSSVVANPTATPTTTVTYSLTVSDGTGNSGCSPATVYTTTVTVNPTPVASPTNDGYICIGGTVNLSANGSGGATVFTWSGSSLSATNIANPTANPVANAVYSLTVSDGTGNNGCSPTTIYTTSVTVNSVPTALPTNNSPICVGGTVALSANPANGANTYTWSGSSLSSSATQNPTATPVATEVYSLVVSDGSGQSGCSPSTVYTTSVTVNPAPSLTSASNDGPICEGTTLNLSANGASNVTGYSWSGPVSITGATSASPSVPAATTAATGVYTVAVNNNTGSGCTVTYTTSATVNALPTVVSITPSSTDMCVGTTLTLTAGTVNGTSSLTSYNWSGPNGYSTTTSGNTATLTPATTAASGIYTLTVTYPGGGCTSNQVTTGTVTVNNLPTISSITVSPGTLCANNPITLTGAGASGATSLVSYNWTGPNSYSSTSATSVQTYTVPGTAASGVYSLSVTYSGTGCTSSQVASNTLTVNPLPTTFNITGGGFYCSGGSGVHIGLDNTETGINYQLYNGSSAVGVAVAGTGSAIDFGLQTAAGTYSVSATNTTTSCSSAMTGTTNVSVGSVPVVYTVTGGGDYCSGGTGVHIGLSSSDVSVAYQLYRGATAVGSLVSGTGTALDFGQFTTVGTYTVMANPSAACAASMSGSATVGTTPSPTQYNVTGGGAYCVGGAGVHIGLDWSVSGVNYQLYNGATPVGSPVAGSSSGLDFGLVTSTGTYTVLATNTSTSCTNAMSGSTTVSTSPLPTVFTVTGGGSYCNGGTGADIGLANSASGINYQLYNGASSAGSPVAGTGSAISFGNQTGTGTYTVLATNTTTACSNAMSGNAVIAVNPLPTVYTVTGGGGYCAGGTGTPVGVSNSASGINYQLYNGASTVGSPVAGTGSAISFGNQTTTGTYTVMATNTSTSCTNAMSGNAVVSINPLPSTYNVTGGGSYCVGGTGRSIGLAGSTTGINYQLYNGASPVGSPIPGASSGLDFGLQTAAGTYTVLATNATTSCTNAMTSSATIVIDPLPTAFTVTGGGSYCNGGAGMPVGLSGSTSGVNYQLYVGSTATGSSVAGNGSAISFGNQTAAGTYTVFATNGTTTCTNSMSGSATISINPLPTTFNVTGGGSYCTGGSGQSIGLSGSVSGINYQLYNGASTVGGAVAGNGSALNFGLQTAAGTYTVLATNTSTSCTNAMSSSATIVVNPLPTAYTVTGGGTFCNGGSGVAIGLGNSTAGINYQLYRGSVLVGSVVAGTGSAISFGNQTVAGTYTVLATNSSTTCTNAMAGSATIGVNPMPNVYTMSGGGSFCNGGTGVHVGLSFSSSGINYQLYRGSIAVGSAMPGSGAALDFGLQTTAGTYTVSATNQITGCTIDMSGSSVVNINALPTVFNMTGGGGYCAGGSGSPVGMAGTASGVNYQLYRGATSVGIPVAGTGSALSFGSQTTAGTYSVLATTTATGCTNTMGGSATVSINALPTAFTVGGGGNYCNGTGGVDVSLSNTNFGINYQLYNGSSTVGSVVSGTGAAIDFGLQTAAGTYTVSAVNVVTNCTSAMSGSATVIVNPLPAAYTVTGGGNYCTGGTGVTVGLSNSDAGINYQLYRAGTAVGSPVAGTGTAITLGSMTIGGTYTVVATNTTTGCVNNMSGSATVTVNAMPNVYVVTGGGAYCAGSTGPHIGTNNSSTGINYQLYNGGSAVGSPVAGSTGMGVDFGTVGTAGTYSVMASNPSTGCAVAMSGTVAVTVNAVPTAFAVSGGGTYCAGGTGVSVGLNGSTSGINYQLYNGSTAVGSAVAGTGSVFSFGIFTATGTYSVAATNNTTGCTSNMTGTAAISTNPLPTAFSVTGGGNFCSGAAGAAVGLSSSTLGVDYQLYRSGTAVGGPVAGTSFPLNFGTFPAAGTYTVSAINTATGCSNNMAGSATIAINPLPTVFTVGGGGAYCTGGAGVNVSLSGSTSGVNYQLYNGSTTVGSPMAGTGVAMDFGMQTSNGTYTVFATNPSTGCTSNMAGNATVVVNAVPVVYNTVGGGSYCAGGSGVVVGLSGSTSGTNYQLYRGSTAVGTAVTGTGSALSFGSQTGAGTYTVLATNASTACTSNMTGTAVVSINTTPAVFAVNGGGGYCAGGSGVVVGLSGSASGVNYRLYNGSTAVGAAVAGTGSAISFGSQLAAGTYTVMATSASSSCTADMTGSVPVVVNALPTANTVTGGGIYCSGGGGVEVALSGSSAGVNYQLYNGSSTVGVAVPGTGSGLNFGMQTNTGAYSVVATDATTGCANSMSGTAIIGTYPLPAAYNLTGGGAYCSGGSGVVIGLSNSNTGVSYQLYNGATASGTPVPGNGSTISFGSRTTAGTYSVLATSVSSSCTNAMNNTVDVIVNPTPTAFVVTGGGNYCAGTSGINIGLNASSSGISYQLYNGSALAGAPVAGTGGSLDFGLQMAVGTYSVLATDATTLCAAAMTGSTTVGVNALPIVYNITGGGNYCSGGTGSVVGLNSSEAGVGYQLYRGSTAVGPAVPGAGGPVSFGSQLVPGVYSVSATNSLTGCNSNMNGTTTIGISALPSVYTVGGGGNYCAGGTGVNITLSGSNTGINYRLYNGSTATGSVVAGSGSGIAFGLQATAGTYTVQAVDATTGCVNNMGGSATIGVNPLPTAFALTGGGSYCAGGTGVVVGLGNSNTGINYQLFNGTIPASGVIPGTGSALNFGAQTGAGTYTVAATDNGTGCANAMSGSAVVSVNALPTAYNVLGGGAYCAGGTGLNISLSSSSTGINYQLYNGSVPVGAAVAGTGAAISFGSQTAAGSYSVFATNTSTTCFGGMTGIASVMVNSLPSVYNVIGGGSYCSGGSGAVVGLENSATGATYQLYNGSAAVGSAVAGTGSGVSFGPQTAAGTYSVIATTSATGCSTAMAGTTIISANVAPTVYTVSGGGNYCAGSAGAHILLSGSNTGISYQAYNGATVVGSPVAGTGSALDLGAVTPAGTYTVLATNATTSCTSSMSGSAVVNVNAAPATFALTGGGNYCAGTGGATIGLSGSQSGVAYQLYVGITPVGTPVAGTGSAISFGPQPAAGSYAVTATNTTTGCLSSMSGTAAVAISPMPTLYTLTGGGNYCAGTPGSHIGLTGSSTTDFYQLYNGAATVGAPIAGTGTAMDFGIFNATGTYSVVAMNSTMTCGRNMTGTTTIGVNALPTVYVVNGGGGYCAGGTGVHVGMANSATGINYQLYNGSAIAGTPVAGTGSTLDFGPQTASGTYTVLATNATTGCGRSMSGTAMVSINALPSAFNVNGGGSYCESGSGIGVGLAGSTSGINYQLYNGSSAMGTPIVGTGAAITFGLQSLPGTYTVMATNGSTTCTRAMTGSASVTIAPSVVPSVTVTKTATSDTICQGTAVTFSALPANAGSAPSYQWRVNGTVVGSGSSYSYAPANHDVITATVISSATCALPAAISQSVTMTVNTTYTPAVAVSLSPNDTVCRGTSVTFTATPSYGGTAPVLAWIKNGINVGSGTTYTYVPSNGDLVYCGMISNYTCRTVNNVSSGTTTMVVNEPPVPVVTISANPGTTISKNETVTFSAAVTNGGPSPTYQWKLNGNAIAAATSATFTGNSFDNNDVVKCEVTSSGPCGGVMSSDNVTITVNSVGVINVAAANIDVNVMPNPNKGEFTVKGDLATKDDVEVTLEVVNMLGQTIYSSKVTANHGNINERIRLDNTLANGMYMLNLRSAAGNKVFHVVVEQ